MIELILKFIGTTFVGLYAAFFLFALVLNTIGFEPHPREEPPHAQGAAPKGGQTTHRKDGSQSTLANRE